MKINEIVANLILDIDKKSNSELEADLINSIRNYAKIKCKEQRSLCMKEALNAKAPKWNAAILDAAEPNFD